MLDDFGMQDSSPGYSGQGLRGIIESWWPYKQESDMNSRQQPEKIIGRTEGMHLVYQGRREKREGGQQYGAYSIQVQHNGIRQGSIAG